MVKGAVADGGFDLVCNAQVDRVAKKGDCFEVNGEAYDLVFTGAAAPDRGGDREIPAEIRRHPGARADLADQRHDR